MTAERRRWIDFASEDEAALWRPLGDVVMGGASTSRLRGAPGGSVFEGAVSLAHGGGFASVRRADEAPRLQGVEALVLRARGDGRTYKLRLGTSPALDAVTYQASFETRNGAWAEHVFTARDFFPVYRGRSVWDAPPLALAAVRNVGLLVSDRQVGPFRLELATLDALVRAAHPAGCGGPTHSEER